MKFGGTSVADPAAIRRLMDCIRRELSAGSSADLVPVLVVSALGGVTDRLLEAARRAEDGDADGAVRILRDIVDRHVAVATALATGPRLDRLLAVLRSEFDGITSLVRALAVLREVSPRSLDAVAASGEVASSRIVAAALEEAGIPSTWVDARLVVATDNEHTAAAPDMEETCRRTVDQVDPARQRGRVAVMGGFIGATRDG